ncbi:trypco2 family protein [Kitasatospora sp. NPDC053057]|uniref:trypco2 family protein n=1 Tax=Kitasatospora sp. NPDC053057 TaxID=3364062 RepID=UPI0037C9BAEF
MTKPLDGVELSMVVQGLRDELETAALNGAGERVGFEVGEIRLEFVVEIHSDSSAKAGFRAWVVTGDAAASRGRRQTHTVSLTLSPRDRRTGESLDIGNEQRADLTAFSPTRDM